MGSLWVQTDGLRGAHHAQQILATSDIAKSFAIDIHVSQTIAAAMKS
jgi:hypothetical protein